MDGSYIQWHVELAPGYREVDKQKPKKVVKTSKDSLADAAGRGVTIEIKGREYEIAPITLGDLAEFESYVRSQRIKSFLSSTEGLDSNERKEVLTELCMRTLADDDVSREMTTLSGVRFLLWRALLKRQPNLTLDDINDLVDISNLDIVSAIVQTVGGAEPENPPNEKEVETS